MATMRAARFHAWGAAPVVEDVPEPIREPGRVLVEVRASAVAHLDATVSGGEFGMRPQLPYIGGVEGAGIVLEADADGPAPGTQVVLRGGGLGILRDGTWTERVSVSAKAVMPLARPLPPEIAASFFVPATTAYIALHDVARLARDDDVIVVGAAGAVGSMIVQQALAAGARVTGVARDTTGVPKGATAVHAEDADAMAQLTAGRTASLLVDTIGGRALAERTRWVRPGGRAVVIGYTAGPCAELDLPSWLLDDVALLPVNMIRRERRAREVAGGLVDLLADGAMSLSVDRFALADAAHALERLRSGRVRGRAVLTP
ncbi:quinone oxidoreductase family protein [Actinospica sp.]|uniref:quinone oxidoreductase family protein n=1 Tax=Actinospica sp. TaxID=1872142 RepID=UPI002D18F2F9|nr:zinc-binding dehydrogenase [Actinospica sp.]HWG23122.1 zinc-binding dehydrogenase [Actinospica sp.]